MRALAPEVIVVVGYGQIIPKSILDIPPQGIINVHASLLPKYRGAAPIQWAIARGESRTGVTTMRINEGLDTGDMLLKWETEIGADETASGIRRATRAGGRGSRWREPSRELATITPEPQDDSQATYAPILKKEDGRVDWNRSAGEILNRIARLRSVAGGLFAACAARNFKSGKRRSRGRKSPPALLRAIDQKLYVGCGDHQGEGHPWNYWRYNWKEKSE